MSELNLAVFVKDETVVQSIIKDLFTCITCGFLVYVSQGSTWWTFVTGLMFILFMFAKVESIIKNNNTFKTKEELQKWVDKLPDA